MRKSTVLIADDHAILREGLITLLNEQYDVVGAVGDGQALIEAAKRLRPDIIVTDLSMPALTGLDVLIRLKAEQSLRSVGISPQALSGGRAAHRD
jgi:DNA-binding NarL/FixJ family response regulator